jgi:hypothetical protein
VVEDPAQECSELLALAVGERGEELVLDGVGDGAELPEATAPGGGDRDDVAAPVGRVGAPLGETIGGQVVDDRDDVTAVEAAASTEFGLAHRSVLVERAQHRVVGAGGAGRGEGVGAQPLGS